MAINNFIPEVWSAELLTSLKKALVFAGPKTVNRDYEGEIRESGDTVRISSISRPTVGTYVKNSTVITFENLTDADRTLLIDQAKYFAFEVDDIDMRQAKDGGRLMTEAADEAAYALADTVDQYVEGLYAGAASANQIGTTAITTAALAHTGLVNLGVKLDEANVPKQGRYAVIPPWYHGLLITPGSSTVPVNESGSDEALRNGFVGRLAGFDLHVSNNCTLITGDDYRVSAGYRGAITFATQINKVEALRPESSFSDALKGLNLYGAKLLRPTGVATLTASKT